MIRAQAAFERMKKAACTPNSTVQAAFSNLPDTENPFWRLP